MRTITLTDAQTRMLRGLAQEQAELHANPAKHTWDWGFATAAHKATIAARAGDWADVVAALDTNTEGA